LIRGSNLKGRISERTIVILSTTDAHLLAPKPPLSTTVNPSQILSGTHPGNCNRHPSLQQFQYHHIPKHSDGSFDGVYGRSTERSDAVAKF